MRNLSVLPLILVCVCSTACPDDPGGTSTGGTDSTSPTSSADGTEAPTDGTDNTDGFETGGSDETYCVHQCQTDADCQIGGMDVDLDCVDGRCEGGDPVDVCTDDEECVAYLSGWTFGPACTMGGGECEAAMQVCVDVDGEGHCATAPSDFISCADFDFDEINIVDIDGNMAVVCGKADAACGPAGFCYDPCASDDECTSESAPVCDMSTSVCECGTDADCQTLGLGQFSSCNAGACGCGVDQDCVDAGAGDVCHPSGQCGCVDDTSCAEIQNTFDGGMISCVQP